MRSIGQAHASLSTRASNKRKGQKLFDKKSLFGLRGYDRYMRSPRADRCSAFKQVLISVQRESIENILARQSIKVSIRLPWPDRCVGSLLDHLLGLVTRNVRWSVGHIGFRDGKYDEMTA